LGATEKKTEKTRPKNNTIKPLSTIGICTMYENPKKDKGGGGGGEGLSKNLNFTKKRKGKP